MSTLNAIDTVGPQNIIAVLDGSGGVTSGILYDGIDHPLRLARSGFRYYYEVDLAGNVRRIRDVNGSDLGGYRYTAFGEEYPADATTPAASIQQPLQWKGRWFNALASGIYDVRARQWSPGMGAFLSVDGFERQDSRSTLWAWGGQNPVRFTDPTGRDESGGVSLPPTPPTGPNQCSLNPHPDDCRADCKQKAQDNYDVCILTYTVFVCGPQRDKDYTSCITKNGCSLP